MWADHGGLFYVLPYVGYSSRIQKDILKCVPPVPHARNARMKTEVRQLKRIESYTNRNATFF